MTDRPPPEVPTPADGGPTGQDPGMDAREAARPLRLLLTLGGAGALAGLLIVGVYQATLPAIEAHRAAALAAAVDEVLGAPDSFRTLYLLDGELQTELPEGTDPRGVPRVHPGFGEDGSLVGFAVEAARPGFQDVIELIFGYDPRTGTVLGMRVLRHMETPGLGDVIVTDAEWVAQFEGARPPLEATSPGEAQEPHEVDMITGATISAETVMLAINDAVERWDEILAEYVPEPPAPGGGPNEAGDSGIDEAAGGPPGAGSKGTEESGSLPGDPVPAGPEDRSGGLPGDDDERGGDGEVGGGP